MEILADLHPHVVHFPIAFLLLYGVLEIIGILSNNKFLQKTAYLLLAVGVVSSIAAVLTGNQAGALAEELNIAGSMVPDEVIEEHENLATITLWYFTAVLVLRTYLAIKKKFTGIIRYIFIPLVLVGSFFIYETGEHGGKLVYEYGLGTDLIKNENQNTDAETDD